MRPGEALFALGAVSVVLGVITQAFAVTGYEVGPAALTRGLGVVLGILAEVIGVVAMAFGLANVPPAEEAPKA